MTRIGSPAGPSGIAEKLILSTATVRLHVSTVLMKLHAANRITAEVIAVENRPV